MRISRVLFPVLAVLALSACAGNTQASENWSDFKSWVRGKPSHLEEKVGRIPNGYAGQNRHNIDQLRKIVRPPTTAEGATEWAQVEGYDDAFADPAFDNQGSVSVFPLDGSEYPAGYSPTGMDAYGSMMQQMFFPHGSAAIAAGDKKSLHSLATSVSPDNSSLLTIVGHASKRVDGVNDPVKKEMINFRMAQKRADAVTRELGRAGLNPAWIVAVSKGDKEPNPAPGARDQESADRRVEVYMGDK